MIASYPAAAAAGDVPCYSRAENAWICGEYVTSRAGLLLDAVGQHVYLTVASVLLGLVLALPLALIARRFKPVEAFILGGTTIIYTIPSLALFSLMVPITGLSATTAIVGLALYSLTILVRNTLAGLRAVPDDVRESAEGLGYGATRMLFNVELPLALPVIMAGLRVATVSTVALVTIGSVVSYGGLGNLLAQGIDDDFKAQILTTSVLVVLLAIIFDALLVLSQRALTPWTHQQKAR